MVDEVNEKICAFVISGVRLTAPAARDVMMSYLYTQNKTAVKPKGTLQGKCSIKQLKNIYGELSSIELNEEDIKAFDRFAKKYHVPYAMKKQQVTNGHGTNRWVGTIFFNYKDLDLMTAAFKEYSQYITLKKEKPSIKEKLKEKSKEMIRAPKKKKIRHKKQELEL